MSRAASVLVQLAATFAAAALAARPAHAGLPEPVRAMIEEAILTGDPDTVKTVAEIARRTNPDAVAELDIMEHSFLDDRDRQLAAAEARRLRAIRDADFLEYWAGNGEIGASRTTGTSSDTGFVGKLSLERSGINWRHKLIARADYQRSNGKTTREQYLFSYEPNYNIAEHAFVYGLAQYERDRFQGFSSRVALSGGVGYRVIDRADLGLSFNGGPAWRRTKLIADGTDTQIAGRASLDFDWSATEVLTLTQDASVFVQADNSTLISITGVEAAIGEGLKARLSYSVEHDTDPPEDAVKTDTFSRFTLIFGF